MIEYDNESGHCLTCKADTLWGDAPHNDVCEAVFEDRRDKMFAEITKKLNRTGRQRGGQFDCGELGICHIDYLSMGRWRGKWYLTERVEDLD